MPKRHSYYFLFFTAMAQLLLTRSSQFHRAIRTQNAFPISFRIGKFFMFFGLTFMIGMLSFLYLMKFTEIHTKGYSLRRLELARSRLTTDRETQSAGIAKLKTLAAIRDSQVVARMVSAPTPVFIKQDGSVAQLPRGMYR